MQPTMDDAVLDIVTISKADHWIEEILPRFAAMIDAHCTGVVRRHLLLLTEGPGEAAARRLRDRWHSVVALPFADPHPDRRLLAYDELRAGLLPLFGLPAALYIDPDTDVVADLQGIQRIAPSADLLWTANALPLRPVHDDLVRHGYAKAGGPPVMLEPGFLYLRRDLRADFVALRERHPDVNAFAPGSTYWNMLMISLGDRAHRLPDEFNRTFWDIPSAATTARSVHFTGQWKRLQPFVAYDRAEGRLIVRPQPAPLPTVPKPGLPTVRGPLPSAVCVVALFRDNAAYLPQAFSRFEAWERAGLPLRYHFLENDSNDSTPSLLADFMQGRRGRLESRQLAIRDERSRSGQNYDRIMPLARMRNHAVDVAMAAAPLADDEWTLLLDSDIFFPDDVLGRIFAARADDPRPDSIGMLTCYTQQIFLPEGMPFGTPAPDHPGHAVAGHYFDTFAFQDADHQHHYPFCAFRRCLRCNASRPANYPLRLVPESDRILDVASAFGGFALVPTAILRDPRIRWTTYSTGFDRTRSLSEHVVFCDRLRTITGKRVVVLQDIDCLYRK